MKEYINIKDFRLSWRWLDPKHTVLPPEVLERIRPLSPQATEQISTNIMDFCRDTVEFLRIEENETTASALAKLPIKDETEIIVSWDSNTAVNTTWGIFRNYWDDFCYPSSDDVSNWPETREWLLCYFHEEVLIYKKFQQSNPPDPRSAGR